MVWFWFGRSGGVLHSHNDDPRCAKVAMGKTKVAAKSSCPTACKGPGIKSGGATNGGRKVVGGVCTGRASKKYGKYRYCGHAGKKAYSGAGTVGCGACKGAPANHGGARPRRAPASHAGGCPGACKAPQIKSGVAKNGGVKLHSGVCTDHASKKYGKYRYCGHAGKAAYSGTGSLSCGACKPPTTPVHGGCPGACKAPQIKSGGSTNGGIKLVSGVCTEQASQKYGKNRYCGHAGKAAYSGKGSLSCGACKAPATHGHRTCPSVCKAPQIKSGQTKNGGIKLVSGVCTEQASKKYGKYRYCGHAGKAAYSGKGSVSCSSCPLPKPRTCPSACKSPQIKSGGSKNGGVKLHSGGVCTEQASKIYGGKYRYCGHAGKAAYSGKGSLSCSACHGVKRKGSCPSVCNMPSVKSGTAKNGGMKLCGRGF